MFVVAVSLAFTSAMAYPATDPADACRAAKATAAGKKAAGLLKAYGKNLKKPDPVKLANSISKAQSKLTKAYATAEGKGSCPTTGDTSAIEAKVDAFAADAVEEVDPPPTTTTTGTPTTTTTSTTLPPVELMGALPPTVGRFNYNLTLGLPGANAACNTNFPGTHACTYAELQIAEAAGDLVGLTDINSNMVTRFWAIDGAQPPLQQCQDDVASFLNWEYGTAHTPSRGQRVTLNNGTGALGVLQSSVQCNIAGTSNVGCCL
jgi:hypothetical protein